MDIIKSIAPRWKQAGVYLDFDPDGKELNLIEAEHGHKANGPIICCQEMLQRWLAGGGVPATWGNLIEVLEDSEETHLVEQVKSALGL